MQLFEADNRERPLSSYAEGNVVWKKHNPKCDKQSTDAYMARPLSAREEETGSGFPADYTKNIAFPASATQNHTHDALRRGALGNSFHPPSVAMFILILLLNISPGVDSCLYDDSFGLQAPHLRSSPATLRYKEEHTVDTVWESGYQPPTAFVGEAPHVLNDALDLFPSKMFPADIVEPVLAAFHGIPVHELRTS